MKGWVLLSLIVVAFVLAACGGGTSDREELSSEEALLLAEAVLLRLDDFSTGWAERPSEREEDIDLDGSEECEEFVDSEIADMPGAIIVTSSPRFHGPAQERVLSRVAVFADENSAAEAYLEYTTSLENCRGEMSAAFEDIIHTQISDDPTVEVTSVEVHLDPLAFATLGDESIAYRFDIVVVIEGAFFEIRGYSDVVMFREGQLMALLEYDSEAVKPDASDEERLARILEERVMEAASSVR